jgi:hypothetical protein
MNKLRQAQKEKEKAQEKGKENNTSNARFSIPKTASKFNVDNNPFAKFQPAANISGVGASIKETMEKLKEAAKARSANLTNGVSGDNNFQGSNNPLFGTRPVSSTTFGNINNRRATPDASNNAQTSFGPPGGFPARNPRYDQQVVKLEHNRAALAAKANGAEPFVRKDRAQPEAYVNNGHKIHQHKKTDGIVIDRAAVEQIVQARRKKAGTDLGPSSYYNKDTGLTEINVSALRAELMHKKEYEEAELEYVATMKKAKAATVVLEVVLPSEGLTIRQLATKLSMRTKEVTKKLVDLGAIGHFNPSAVNSEDPDAVTLNADDRMIDADSAELMVLDMGFDVKRIEDKSAARVAAITERPSHAMDENVVMVPRAPVVSCCFLIVHCKAVMDVRAVYVLLVLLISHVAHDFVLFLI